MSGRHVHCCLASFVYTDCPTEPSNCLMPFSSFSALPVGKTGPGIKMLDDWKLVTDAKRKTTVLVQVTDWGSGRTTCVLAIVQSVPLFISKWIIWDKNDRHQKSTPVLHCIWLKPIVGSDLKNALADLGVRHPAKVGRTESKVCSVCRQHCTCGKSGNRKG